MSITNFRKKEWIKNIKIWNLIERNICKVKIGKKIEKTVKKRNSKKPCFSVIKKKRVKIRLFQRFFFKKTSKKWHFQKKSLFWKKKKPYFQTFFRFFKKHCKTKGTKNSKICQKSSLQMSLSTLIIIYSMWCST